MNHLTIEKNNCTIKLNKKFYPDDIIAQGIQNFDKSLDISLKEDLIVITGKELEKTGYEFCDYLLSLMQEGGII